MHSIDTKQYKLNPTKRQLMSNTDSLSKYVQYRSPYVVVAKPEIYGINILPNDKNVEVDSLLS